MKFKAFFYIKQYSDNIVKNSLLRKISVAYVFTFDNIRLDFASRNISLIILKQNEMLNKVISCLTSKIKEIVASLNFVANIHI